MSCKYYFIDETMIIVTKKVNNYICRGYSVPLLLLMGAVAHGLSRSIKFSQIFLSLLHCVLLYVCRLCINYQDLSTNLLGVASLHISMVTFYTPKCCKLHDDSFPLYCATEGGTENLLRTLT